MSIPFTIFIEICPVLLASLCVPFTNSLIECYIILMFATIILGFLWPFYSLWITQLSFLCLGSSGFATTHMDVSAPGHNFEYWIEHFTFGLFYAIFRFSSSNFYRGVPGFATDCPCGVWCRGLTICLLYIGPRFGNLVWNNSWFVSVS